ncbi:MAG: hypothetical protein V1849_02075 [Chloroflexota bacterium]
MEKTETLSTETARVLQGLEEAIAGGKHWYLALLEAIRAWRQPEEVHQGRSYRYLIVGEAFDWLLLAERLCQAVAGLLPQEEKTALLFYSQPPLELSQAEFKEHIGALKYRQHLNYFYGVTVEQSLILAVEDEVRKERRCQGYYRERDETPEVFRRVYGTTRTVLLKHFRKEKGYPQIDSISLSELKEFTYWLFKYRLEHSDKARVASDIKKALRYLEEVGYHGLPIPRRPGVQASG